MSRKKKTKKRRFETTIEPETKETIIAVVFFILALFLTIAGFGGGGVAGHVVVEALTFLLGVGYALLPVLFLLVGLSYISAFSPKAAFPRILSALLFLLSGLAIIETAGDAGGLIGHAIAYPLVYLFDAYVAILILGGIFIISLLLLFNKRPNFTTLVATLKERFSRRDDDWDTEYAIEEEVEEEEPEEEVVQEDVVTEPKLNQFNEQEDEEEEFPVTKTKRKTSSYVPPPLSILERDRGKPNTGDIKANANVIKRTLQNFGIEVEMDEVTIGPTVTRYALKPAEGVKLSRIVGLQNDLSLALAAHPLRIQAPIPGKSLVGIEVPNKLKSTVGLASMLSSSEFKQPNKPLMMAIGKNIAGITFFGNLSKMPHLLIAGATGSGKSVTIHALITSLLYRNSPEDLRFIMVDPKRVELTLYNKIPHLLTPVIKQSKKAILALKWAAKEMERRYDILEAEQVRDISSYHEVIANRNDEDLDRMPYIVIIIDELADIMQSYPRELEAAIVRLAQMSRAVGIHLILSTQRPSVNIITGLIKANIPARIALQVSSNVDSRTILDAGGAEKLLGAGDMLYLSGDMSQAERLQSAFISETEVKKVVKYLAHTYRDEVPNDIELSGDTSPENTIFSATLDDDDEDDELYEEAKAVVIEAGKASTSYLQRKLKVGYARAARIIDLLEERGIVGPADGSKPREVLTEVSEDPYEQADQ